MVSAEVSHWIGGPEMSNDEAMPSALQVAEAMAQVLRRKLADHIAQEIVLTRDEAALCLGLAEGVAENLGGSHDPGE
jgi:hypothetical protein